MPTQLSFACTNNDIAAVKSILSSKKTPIDVNEDYGIAIREATRVGNLEIVLLLVKAGADPHVISDAPLRISAEYGHTNLFQYYRDLGAPIDEFCLRVAVKNGFIDIVKAILASPTHKLTVSLDMIQSARDNNHKAMVRYLTENHGDADDCRE